MANRKLPLIEVGFPVFLSDGGDAFGAVRRVLWQGRPELLVYVENAGDFSIPLDAVEKVVSGKVVVRWDALDEALKRALEHTMDQEDFPPEDEPEVELIGPTDEDERDDESFAPYYDVRPPTTRLDELPGRDIGSRYGAPPSVTSLSRRVRPAGAPPSRPPRPAAGEPQGEGGGASGDGERRSDR